MYKFLLSLFFVVILSASCYAQNYSCQNRGRVIGYQPIVQYYPQGINFNIGSVYVSPNRKYIRIGGYGGYWRYQGVPIYYDFRTGTYRPYYRR